MTSRSVFEGFLDTFVGSILSYSCEVWGFNKCKNIENIHLKFLKLLLGVKKSTSSMAVHGETGRYPLYINRYVRMVKYWGQYHNENYV